MLEFVLSLRVHHTLSIVSLFHSFQIISTYMSQFIPTGISIDIMGIVTSVRVFSVVWWRQKPDHRQIKDK